PVRLAEKVPRGDVDATEDRRLRPVGRAAVVAVEHVLSQRLEGTHVATEHEVLDEVCGLGREIEGSHRHRRGEDLAITGQVLFRVEADEHPHRPADAGYRIGDGEDLVPDEPHQSPGSVETASMSPRM